MKIHSTNFARKKSPVSAVLSAIVAMLDFEVQFIEKEIEWKWYIQQVIFKIFRPAKAAKTSGVQTTK